MKKAFSLIELLISLIVISVIIASFTPVLSKKLKHRELALAAAKQMKIDCSPFNTSQGQCLLCTESQCNLCTSSINVPDGYFVNPNQTCNKKSCTLFDPNCKRCTKDGCQECKSGYTLNSGGCSQIKCAKGYYVSNSSCLLCGTGQYQPNDNFTGTSCIACTGNNASVDAAHTTCTTFNCPLHCKTCSSATVCTLCENGWHLEGGECAEDSREVLPSVENCAKINAIYIKKEYNGTGGVDLCVSKYNIGDTNGPDIASSTSKRTVDGTETSECVNCCWQGKTASTCTNNGKASSIVKDFDYSGCNRTVCTWRAGYDGCSNYQYRSGKIVATGWRLPKESELTGWKNNIDNISKKIGTDGLQFCDHETTAKKSPVCYGQNGKCKGAFDGDCRPRRVWSDSSGVVFALENGIFTKQTSDLKANTAASVRCVIEKFIE